MYRSGRLMPHSVLPANGWKKLLLMLDVPLFLFFFLFFLHAMAHLDLLFQVSVTC
jgi:hypothetical protein